MGRKKLRHKYNVFQIKVPKKYYPRRKNSKCTNYELKMREILEILHDIELELEKKLRQSKATKSLLFSKKRGERPTNIIEIRQLKINFDQFFYEYENFCLRIYIYRETLSEFLAEFFGMSINRKLHEIMDDTLMKQTGISKCLSEFTKKPLLTIIEYRNMLTHKISKDSISERSIDNDIERAEQNIKTVNKSLTKVMQIHNDVAQKLVEYKERNRVLH